MNEDLVRPRPAQDKLQIEINDLNKTMSFLTSLSDPTIENQKSLKRAWSYLKQKNQNLNAEITIQSMIVRIFCQKIG